MEKLREKMFTLLLHAIFFIWMWAFSDDTPAAPEQHSPPAISTISLDHVLERSDTPSTEQEESPKAANSYMNEASILYGLPASLSATHTKAARNSPVIPKVLASAAVETRNGPYELNFPAVEETRAYSTANSCNMRY